MSLKSKRIAFILSLVILSVACFIVMNRRYDELARYTYKEDLTEEQRELILDKLNTEDINYLSAQQIKPEEFLPFISEEGFSIRYAQWYSRAANVRENDNAKIVKFINTFHDRITLGDLEPMLNSYSYDTLETFYTKGDPLVKNAAIVVDPSAQHLVLTSTMSVYTYVPKDLVAISDVPYVNLINDDEQLYIKSEVMEPLKNLCIAAEEINGSTCGDMIVTEAYISYKDQLGEYEKMMLKYGHDNFTKYTSYPGQSESQLGYTLKFAPAGSDSESSEDGEKQQATWLNENAYKFGFIVRYPKDKETITGKLSQPYTIRYVGLKVAKEMHDKQYTLNEMVFKNE